MIALLGPLVLKVVDYRVTVTLRKQPIGLGTVSLFVGAPLALFAATLVRRGALAGYALALAARVRPVRPCISRRNGFHLRVRGCLAGTAFFWTIALLDLGVFLPATVATCVGLEQGACWAHKALHLVAGWFGLVGTAVAAMALAMQINADPNANTGNTILMTLLGAAFALLTIAVYRPIPRRSIP